MEKEEEKEVGMIRGLVDAFTDQMKEMTPVESAAVFIVLTLIGTFGIIGFTSAIAGGVVKIIQIIGTIAVAL